MEDSNRVQIRYIIYNTFLQIQAKTEAEAVFFFTEEAIVEEVVEINQVEEDQEQ